MTIVGMHSHLRDRVYGGGGGSWDGPRAAVKIAKGESTGAGKITSHGLREIW